MSLSESPSHSTVDLPEKKSKDNGEAVDERKDDTYSPASMRRMSRREVRQSVRKVLKKSSNKQYHDDCKHGIFGRIFFNCVWLTVLGVMIYYTYEIATQYQTDSRNPSNTVTYIEQEELPLPQVVVCNWNSLTNGSTSNISYFVLDLVDCVFVNSSADCTAGWKPIVYSTIAGTFYCYTFNDDPNNVTWSVTTSYAGSYASVFRVNIPKTTTLPTANSTRGGLQVTFGVPGTITADDIYREIRFAQIGTDTFYAISAINTIRGDLSPDSPTYNTTMFVTTSSSVTLLNAFQHSFESATTGYIGVSFSFQTLNLEVITYGFSYTLENFFGDFAGMIGTLMGLDTIKVMAAIPVGWAAIKMRSCVPLEDLFNG